VKNIESKKWRIQSLIGSLRENLKIVYMKQINRFKESTARYASDRIISPKGVILTHLNFTENVGEYVDERKMKKNSEKNPESFGG